MTAQAHLLSWNYSKLASLCTKLAAQARRTGHLVEAETMHRRAQVYATKSARWMEVA